MFPAWVIIVLILFGLLIVLFRSTNQIYILTIIKENFFYIFAVAVFIFLAVSLVHIHATNDIDFSSYEGVTAALRIYFSWLGQVFSNFGKITGYALQQDWFKNSTGK